MTKEKKVHIRLGFSGKESKEIVDSMNVLLANYHVFYQKLLIE